MTGQKEKEFGFLFVLLLAGAGFSGESQAGPPFVTDDPEPIEHRHGEAYIFTTIETNGKGTELVAPAFEANYGPFSNVHLHLVVPFALSAPEGAPQEYGLGDMEIGAKYLFLTETAGRPQIGIFPLLEIPTGDEGKGLGNGQVWAKFPLWIQKSWGPWKSYGGGGYAVNRAPGMKSFAFGGVLLQRELSKKISLGGEIFGQQPDEAGGDPAVLYNIGGQYNINNHYSILFSAGHIFTGEQRFIGYLGLYGTWDLSRKKKEVNYVSH